jgi:hypothetical protein
MPATMGSLERAKAGQAPPEHDRRRREHKNQHWKHGTH